MDPEKELCLTALRALERKTGLEREPADSGGGFHIH